MKNILLGCLFTLAAIVLSSCNNTANSNSGVNRASNSVTSAPSNAVVVNANSSAVNSNSMSAKESFWTEAAAGGMAEVELGKLASTKAQNAEVKKFGAMMVADHSKANDELKALAARKSVTLPAAVGPKHQSTIDRLKGMSGAEFDRAYVEDMVKDHEADVQMFEKQSADNTDAELKAFAAKTLPTLKKHLEEIKNIQAKLK